MANYTYLIATGGTLYKPHVVRSIVDPITKDEQIIEPEIISSKQFDLNNINAVKLGMKDCVDYGSCHRLAYLPFSSGAKTGTAQFNNKKTPHSWFASFAPYEKPEIIVVILVEEGGDRGLAVTVARQFMEWYFNR